MRKAVKEGEGLPLRLGAGVVLYRFLKKRRIRTLLL
jgi:hypothetical protein